LSREAATIALLPEICDVGKPKAGAGNPLLVGIEDRGIAVRRDASGGRSPESHVIAVCLAGFSPAVVTETLYALAVGRRPKIIPKRVVILTTEDACGSVIASLAGRNGAIRRLANEYRLPDDSLVCDSSDVLVLRSRSGKPLGDIRSSADSMAAGETIAELLNRLHSDPGAHLHCSLAGGRKTMGALLALALQLCARPGDRLYHVLVNEPFEKIPEFFYPPRRPRFYVLDGRRIDSRLARVDLAEIPLVRLGAVAESLGFDREDLARRAEAIEAAVTGSVRMPSLVLDFATRRLRIDGMEIHLPPQEFALYALYAFLRSGCRRCAKRHEMGCAACRVTDDELFEKHRGSLLDIYMRCGPASGSRLVGRLRDRSGSGELREDFGEWLRQTRSRLNRILRRARAWNIGPCLVLSWRNPESKTGAEGRRGLSLSPKNISLVNVEIKTSTLGIDPGCHSRL
jgi:CRISPR-associated protein (TIGR02584 family)